MEIDVGFTATSDAAEEAGGAGGFVEGLQGLLLMQIELDMRFISSKFGCVSRNRISNKPARLLDGFCGSARGEAGGEHEIGAGGEGRKVIL